jgi:hypothetical protein
MTPLKCDGVHADISPPPLPTFACGQTLKGAPGTNMSMHICNINSTHCKIYETDVALSTGRTRGADLS